MIREIKANQQDIRKVSKVSKVRNVQAKEKLASLPPEPEQTRKNVDMVELGSSETPSLLYTRSKG